MIPYNKKLKQLSRELRENMTEAERLLWRKIRMKQLNGYQFYRQKPIDDYIVDFYCPKAKFIIEVDGSQHFDGENIENDRIRDEVINGLGLKILRFTNVEVMTDIDGVVENILENMRSVE